MSDRIKLVAAILPYLIIAGIISGFILAFSVGRPDLATRGLGIAIPALLSAFVLLQIYKEEFNEVKSIIFWPFNQRTLILLFGILFMTSLPILILTSYRPWYYFLLMSALHVLIFIQIFSKNPIPTVILLEIMLTLINLIYGITFKYPLYFGSTDIIWHIFFSKVTYLSGRVIPADLSIEYAYFPLYHIFIAESSYILNLNIKTSLFVVATIPYVTTIIFVYYLFSKIMQNEQISLLVSLLYSSSYVVIYYGSYIVTRVMAFIGFIILIYLFYKNMNSEHNIIYKILSLFMAVFIMLVHNVSIPQTVMLLTILFICERITSKRKYLDWNLFVIINIMFLGYWLYTAWLFTRYIITTHIRLLYSTELTIISIQSGDNIHFLLTHIDTSIFTFFALIGVGHILWNKKQRHSTVFGLFALLTLLFYIPNPLHVLWQTGDLLRFDRLKLLVSPFMAFIMGWGIYVFHNYLVSKSRILGKVSVVILILVIAVFSFVSITMHDNANDSKDFPWRNPRTYFDKEELYGFNYITKQIPSGSKLYSDYYTYRFFEPLKKFSLSKTLNFPFYTNRIISNVEYIPNYDGYIVIRKKEFFNEGLYIGNIPYLKLYNPTKEDTNRLFYNLQKENRIYSNYAVEIYN